jgi:mono/diheme cytochrome c family protein
MNRNLPVRPFGALLALAIGAATPAAGAAPVAFNRDIRPILSDNCFACHGFDAEKRKAGLRLDTPEGAFAANKDGKVAIQPGDPDASGLWARLNTTDADDVMPPPETHKQLTAEQKALVKRWIEGGATYQKHWAFEPVAHPLVPEVKSVSNPVDRFVRVRLAEEKLTPAPESDRTTAIRRLSFDLRGLPPTPAEVDQFLADRRPDAYERLVDRLLDSPHYGEHMAKHWLDVARYADTHGMHLDNERQMWAYRDWVVKAFNRNLSFDRFTVEQLAGDLLPEPTTEQLVATGFNRCNVTTGEGGSIDAEWIFRYAVDRTSTTVQAWLGLTAGCAVCHDHKFDPLSQKEFYSLYAFFHSAADPAMDGNVLRTAPTVQLKGEEEDRRLAGLKTEIRAAEAKLGGALKAVSYVDPASLTPPPTPRDEEMVWLEDDVPAGFKAQGAPNFVGEGQPVLSGRKALRLKAGDGVQEVFESSAPALTVPQNARLFAHVYLDPKDPPKQVMLQFNTGDWEHRAVWGDIEAIQWGEKGEASRRHMGALPKSGEWVRLEVDAAEVGLKAGDPIRGLAYTQFAGTVFWDRAGVRGRIDPANDPTRSFVAWTRQYDGKDANGLPDDLRKIFKDVPATNRTPGQVAQLREYYLSRACATTKPTFAPLTEAVTAAQKRHNDYNEGIVQSFIFRDLDQPRESFVMLRGAYDKPGERVFRNVPAVLPPLRQTNSPDRLALAEWLVNDENPLTARVTVNRFWQQFFGTGLVKTADDFGSQGEPPTHPELLDWLASHFRDSGWDVKGLVRLLVTSATYRQDSRVSPNLLQRDPANRLLARGPRFRLDAEQLRDNALFISGLMDLTFGGKGVKTYQPPNIWEPVAYSGSNTKDYKQDTGNALYRRSLYAFFKRTAPHPFMGNFDAPNRELMCPGRERSNTPLQALQLMNDVQHFEAARNLAQRMLKEGGKTAADRLAFGYRAVLGRKPSGGEVTVLAKTLKQHLARYEADAEAAKQVITFGESKPDESLKAPEVAAYTLTANLLLNLDETVTRN